MHTLPRISVIMSVFNGQPYLEESVSSVLGQSLTDLEFIAIDDGSSDGSWQTLQAAAARDARMIVLRNETNLGYAASQNRALEYARGRYLALQDQDDASLPHRLEVQARFLDAHPEIGVVGLWPVFVDEGGEVLASEGFVRLLDNESLQQRLLYTNCFCGPSVMARRGLVSAVGGYDPALRSAEDHDLLLRLAEVTQLANLPDELYRYRQHRESVSKLRRFEQMRNSAVALERAALRRGGGSPSAELSRAVARGFLRAAYIGFFVDEIDQARAVLRKASLHAPDMFRSGALVENVLSRYVVQQQLFEPAAHIRALFDDLLPKTRLMARTRSRLLSKVHMREVFEGWRIGPPGRIAAHWWAGLRLDPRWALNRGVWSIGVRHVFPCLLWGRGPLRKALPHQNGPVG